MNKKRDTHENIRKAVAQDYAHAVTSPSSCCCGNKDPKGVAAKLAGYTKEELAGLPVEAIVNSFGCGNPLAFSGVKSGDTVLDLGSGAGIDLLIAWRKVGATGHVIGIDMTDAMITKARENIAAARAENIEVRKGLIEELPVESGSVDWVISNCVINLSPEKNKVFAEIARILKPGGQMLVSDIVAEELPDELKCNKALYSSCLSGAIAEEDYLKGLRDAGLSDAVVRERLVYDADQLKAFIGSELKHDQHSKSSSCGNDLERSLAENWAPRLLGKVWSAKIYAKKPS